MKIIGLTQGKYALIDDDDLPEISKYTWYAVKNHNRGVYAKNHELGYMHKFISKIHGLDFIIDHADRNGLNNQKHNLRSATIGQNCANRKPRRKYKGITRRFNNRDGKKTYCNCWLASCKKDGVLYTKTASTEVEAALAYNEMALKYHGEFAFQNSIID